MTPDLVVAIDCSTTSVKCVIWDARGNLVASGRSSLDLRVPSAGLAEQDPRQWWSGMCSAVNDAMRSLDPRRMAAICVTHQRESFVCLDSSDEAAYPAILWLDSRATEEVESAGTTRVHEVTGKPPNVTPAFYKLLWLHKHEPDVLARTTHVVEVHGYLVHKMTGLWRTSIGSADPMGLVDLSRGDYDDELLAQVGLSRSQLCELYPPGEVLGALTEGAAGALSLPPGLPVISGVGDGQAAALGANNSRPGTAYLNLGTGLVSGSYSDTYVPDRSYRALTGAIPGSFSLETFIGAGTYMITWFIDTFVGRETVAPATDESIEQRLEIEAAEVDPGSAGLFVVPYWNGALTPYWDHNARGIMLGFTGIHDRAHVYRAVLEGLAYELRLCLDRVEAATSDRAEVFVAMGGGSQSALWCQILADVLRRQIIVSGQQESTCLGAGMLASAGVGLHSSIGEASAAMSSRGRTFHPSEEQSVVYDRYFEVYREIYPSTRQLVADLAAVTQ